MPGTKIELTRPLQECLEKAKEMDLSEQELESYIEDCVESYWRHPDNAASRDQTKHTPLPDRGIDPEILVELAVNFDEPLEWLAGWAESNKGAFEDLKNALVERLENGKITGITLSEAAKVIRGKYKPKGSGAPPSPGISHKNLQLALAVGAVLKSELGRSTNKAIADVAAATDIEDPSVKSAWYSLASLELPNLKRIQ